MNIILKIAFTLVLFLGLQYLLLFGLHFTDSQGSLLGPTLVFMGFYDLITTLFWIIPLIIFKNINNKRLVLLFIVNVFLYVALMYLVMLYFPENYFWYINK